MWHCFIKGTKLQFSDLDQWNKAEDVEMCEGTGLPTGKYGFDGLRVMDYEQSDVMTGTKHVSWQLLRLETINTNTGKMKTANINTNEKKIFFSILLFLLLLLHF